MSRGRFLEIPSQISQRSRSLSPSFQQSNPFFPLSAQDGSLYRHTDANGWRPFPIPRSAFGVVELDHTIPKFQVITWNIEFSAPHIEERTNGILDYIWNYTLELNSQTLGRIPTILLFQEVSAEAFLAFLSHPFIRFNYDLTDINRRNFDSHYGTITCIPRPLTPFVTAINRVPFENSIMGRDALIIDLDLPHFPSFRHSFPYRPNISRIRICNTHLESLRGRGDSARPKQLQHISQLLFSADGGLVAGDMNAIAPTDDPAPSALGFADAWEVVHPQAFPVDGHTWGYQPPSRRYPPRRLDKVLFLGNLTPVSIERLGVGRRVEAEGSSAWLSDHYGLLAQFTVG
ncbi:hypothetical protein D9756_005493 [Leucocoprinus leucothites]|uniref:Endonuclease/exonuclease/phosphatase domain-containing protein n=1 Tax=Leucocoprinus leucothites TaxID=201217 RepID=A0A8H5FZT5_9AGAR|nr:hypothetical protein D9756_005493 [Leucoagaricus leucothites]